MRRAFCLAWAVVLCAFASAQQPDFRVRLFSVHDSRSVLVLPQKDAALAKCRGCQPLPLRAETALTGAGALVVFNGMRSPLVLVTGGVRIRSADGFERDSTYPLSISSQSGVLKIVAAMTLEEYAAEAVQGETAGQMAPDALKAMAVVVRSYATSLRRRHRTEGFDLCDSTHCQNLRPELAQNVRNAVAATRGELLWSKGSPAMAFHHKDCGGKLEAAHNVWPDIRSEYLPPHDDPYCKRTQQGWRSALTKSQISRALAESGVRLNEPWSHIVIDSRTESGRARTLRFDTDSGAGPRVSASTFRTAVGRTFGWQSIKSDLYEISQSRERFTFVGRGVGHGVGLCQSGTAEMALEGKSYREILAFYYPGTSIGVSAQGISWIKHTEEGFTLLTTSKNLDPGVREAARSALNKAERITEISGHEDFEIRIYPSVAMFRDSTGEPGWVAATTRGQVIELQPPALLARAGGVGKVLQHEFVHALLESVASPSTPKWYREGLAIYLSGEISQRSACDMTLVELETTIQARSSEATLRHAYGAASGRVAQLARRAGRDQFLLWLRNGLPLDIRSGTGFGCHESAEHPSSSQTAQHQQ